MHNIPSVQYEWFISLNAKVVSKRMFWISCAVNFVLNLVLYVNFLSGKITTNMITPVCNNFINLLIWRSIFGT